MTAHIISVRMNLLIFGILIILTFTTVAVDFIDMGSFNLVVAITIAVIKALLVALYFMHLRYSSRLTLVYMVGAVCWLLLLITITLGEFMSRSWVGVPKPW